MLIKNRYKFKIDIIYPVFSPHFDRDIIKYIQNIICRLFSYLPVNQFLVIENGADEIGHILNEIGSDVFGKFLTASRKGHARIGIDWQGDVVAHVHVIQPPMIGL